MAKKIISFLGSGNYTKVKYSFTDEQGKYNMIETRFIQQAVHKLVGDDVTLYIGITDLSKKSNWDSGNKIITDFETCKKEQVYMVGLKEILDNNDIPYKEIKLKDGQNEKQIWDNFDSIFNVLEEGDELYIDITHSFRSIPIIMMSIVNYAKFIKNISIKGIYYGAFDAQNDGIAPIIDLSIYNSITDWTIGAEKFISTGDITSLNNQVSQTIREYKGKIRGSDEESESLRSVNSLLEDFSKSLYTVRGMKISEEGFQLKRALEDVKEINIDELKPFREILDKIYKRVSMYSGYVLKDIHYTVKLCVELNLIQQAYTLLRENIVSFVCLAAEMDIKDSKIREVIEKSIGCRHPEMNFKVKEENLAIDEKLASYIDENLAKLFDKIGKYRNDLNHGGYRSDPSTPDKFKKEIKIDIKEFEDIVDLDELKLKNPCVGICPNISNMHSKSKMMLIFSHNLTKEQIKDAKENFNIKEFLKLPQELQENWSMISPDLDNISNELEKIKDWISKVSNSNDYILVQGDFGATYEIVNHCKARNLKTVYSTTIRQANEVERDDGKIEITHVFNHIKFREY